MNEHIHTPVTEDRCTSASVYHPLPTPAITQVSPSQVHNHLLIQDQMHTPITAASSSSPEAHKEHSRTDTVATHIDPVIIVHIPTYGHTTPQSCTPHTNPGPATVGTLITTPKPTLIQHNSMISLPHATLKGSLIIRSSSPWNLFFW